MQDDNGSWFHPALGVIKIRDEKTGENTSRAMFDWFDLRGDLQTSCESLREARQIAMRRHRATAGAWE